ncbi:RNA polymerase sigma factor [Sphingomonas azotifigens]|uniref:RNA polymerase sigma factor n=1 Tax=Sphingomonas azotifigens TaxID=330920 RepID=UPI000A0742FA|nr:sigma-70 family RNA polymerase sigma factor [Sphingomonas azotifigens]
MTEMGTVAAERRVISEEVALRAALQRFVQMRLRDDHEGEDIVQETYIRLYDYRRSRSVADVGAFCFAVARNLVFDHFRRRRALPRAAELADDIPCAQPRAEEVLDYRQRVDILARALRVMPPLRREVFLRRRLDGVAVAIIAADLEMSVAAVEKHCVRAVADLRAALERRGLPGGAAR